MITEEVTGADKVTAYLNRFPDGLFMSLRSTLDTWATELASYIKESKLSGDPLHRRSGNLSASVHPESGHDAEMVFGGAAAGAGLPYAHIHEYGGAIPPRVAINARALAIRLPGGETIFRKSARGFQMPERSYMRSSLKDKFPSGLEAIRKAIHEYIVGAV